jgi:hypothetical protein
MLATAALLAGLAFGLMVGLLAKRNRPRFSSCCGTTLGCTTCGKSGESARAAARSRWASAPLAVRRGPPRTEGSRKNG